MRRESSKGKIKFVQSTYALSIYPRVAALFLIVKTRNISNAQSEMFRQLLNSNRMEPSYYVD